MQCIVVKSGEFENSYSLLYIFFLNPVYVAARSLRSNKLRHYGVRGIVIYWFTSYLTGRKQISIFIGNSCAAQMMPTRVEWMYGIHCVLEF